jgi:hypothetical protein
VKLTNKTERSPQSALLSRGTATRHALSPAVAEEQSFCPLGRSGGEGVTRTLALAKQDALSAAFREALEGLHPHTPT